MTDKPDLAALAGREPDNIEKHPCYSERYKKLSHRSGGFGGTCERCGTKIEGANHKVSGPISWEPVKHPKPFCPGGVERLIYDTLRATDAPIHTGWLEKMATDVAAALRAQAETKS